MRRVHRMCALRNARVYYFRVYSCGERGIVYNTYIQPLHIIKPRATGEFQAKPADGCAIILAYRLVRCCGQLFSYKLIAGAQRESRFRRLLLICLYIILPRSLQMLCVLAFSSYISACSHDMHARGRERKRGKTLYTLLQRGVKNTNNKFVVNQASISQRQCPMIKE